MRVHELDEFMVKRGGSVNPSKFKDEMFELLSISGFDNGSPEVLEGNEIGSTKQKVEPRDVLLSKIVPHIRRCWVVPLNNEHRQIASGEWIVFRNKDWCPEYAKYFLTSDSFHPQFMNTVAGVGGSLLRARPAFVSKIKIPLPPLAEQRRIVEILDAAQALIDQRKEQIALMDQLVQSLFYTMFGDPVTNPMGWEKEKLGDQSVFENGDRSAKYPSGEDIKTEGMLFLSTKNIVEDKFNLASRSFITREKFDSLSRGKTRRGDLLITLRGTLGSCCIFDCEYETAFINAQMMIIRSSSSMNPIFLHALLTSESLKNCFDRLGHGGAVPQLTARQLSLLEIPVPPLSLQTEFANRVEVIESQKAAMLASLSELEDNFNALMQQAFKGELEWKRS